MPKKTRIGEDIVGKTPTATISSPKDSEEFEKFVEKRRKQKAEEIRSKMPDEPEPTSDEEERERAREYAELEKARAEGRLKPKKEAKNEK